MNIPVPHLAILRALCGFAVAVILGALYMVSLLQLFAWLAR